MCYMYPFCMWTFGPMGSSFTHTHKDLPVSCKVKGSNLTRCHKDGVITRHKDVVTKMGVITNIIAQEQTYIKSSQVKCIQIHSLLQSSFIRCFNNQISTTFWKSSKPFLVKIICILSKYFVSISQVTRQGKHL